ncbi:hypothetical protein LEMA_P087630.1 [Plenodomus lingam JN3]|uniref:Rhodopsin domain-containing protein n=1 Tax=Leptosphaeria maculans (strain JN3 / isolate v23.1.3 / race Av1-4-5-6-7-8) TaxID=985895 RepID=E5A7C9_LEPMJ|nr:hypothetical protein LEMA_P087630.1 [Plenodomus lingam JN3]CBX99524.1 hypothetical protein LEMA_P087630.1 [Plenodomus lingam JN3]
MAVTRLPRADVPSFDAEKQHKIDHAGKINRKSFDGLLWSFLIIAVLACGARLIFRFKKQRKFFADDAFVFFSTLCLIANTGVMWHAADKMYMIEAVNSDPTITFTVPELIPLLDLNKWIFIYLALDWTAIYAIKMSFLIFFRPLIRNLSVSLHRFYWICWVINVVAWMFVVGEPFILCPYFGMEAMKCYPNTQFKLNLAMSILTLLLNITTDIMIITIPLLLLRLSQMRIEQKASIASFLCLSISMIIITIIRLAGGLHESVRGEREFSLVWTHILLHVESGVAILMACLVAFRTIFANQIAQLRHDESTSWYHRLITRIRGGSSAKQSRESSGEHSVHPHVSKGPSTRITMQSLRNFIRGDSASRGMTTLGSVSDPVEQYHEFMRNDARRNESGRSTKAHVPLSEISPNSTSRMV